MQNTSIDSRTFRDVLGHSPTSVAAVTALDASGAPIGMIVGTFTSVSLDPPLVGFLPDKSSTTFPRIRESRSFCVNILAAGQESVCRALSAKSDDRFAEVSWRPAPSGAPIIDDVVAWIDCVPESSVEAGDHYFFTGRVIDMAVERPTFPLVFFQGGFGAFVSRSTVIETREGLADQIRLADLAREEVESLARSASSECRLIATADERQVVIASADGANRAPSSLVGVSMPMVPPFGQLFMAWESPDSIERWLNSAPTPMDAERRTTLIEELSAIRRDGLMLRFTDEFASETSAALTAVATHGQTPRLEREFASIGAKIDRLRIGMDHLTDDAAAEETRFMFAPIFDPSGRPVAGLMLVNLPARRNLAFVREATTRLLESAARISRRLADSVPNRS